MGQSCGRTWSDACGNLGPCPSSAVGLGKDSGCLLTYRLQCSLIHRRAKKKKTHKISLSKIKLKLCLTVFIKFIVKLLDNDIFCLLNMCC